jgi:hypothetical protein
MKIEHDKLLHFFSSASHERRDASHSIVSIDVHMAFFSHVSETRIIKGFEDLKRTRDKRGKE